MSQIRTFIAVEISPSVRSRAVKLIKRLQVSGADVKWVAAENLHITLKFLGDVPDRELGGVCGAVKKAAAAIAPFEFVCRGAGAFPDARRPRTLWIGVGIGERELAALHAAIEREFLPLGFRKDGRRFHPHLTIGRVRRGRLGLGDLSELIRDNAELEMESTVAAKVVVYASNLDSAGPSYEPLARPVLGG